MLAQPPLWLILVGFVCLLGPVVFFHELGHYLVARLFNVGAEVFSIGFGHEIVGWTDRRGTRWKVGWLPLGGYVKFVGDMGPASDPADAEDIPAELRDHAFQFRPVWQRFLIVLAGPVANFLLAIIIFTAFFTFVGTPLNNVVENVQPNSAAAVAGIQPGDRIVSVAGLTTTNYDEVTRVVGVRPNETVSITIERNGTSRQLQVTLRSEQFEALPGRKATRGLLGVYFSPRSGDPAPLYQSIPLAFDYTARLTRTLIDGLGQIINGRVSPRDMGGPITIARVAGQGAELGLFPFIGLVAFLSINLGFINLLPVPMLDGGHLFFYAVEAVRRRPLDARSLEWAYRGGVALIFALMLFLTINDLGSLGLWDRLQRLIG